MLVSLGVPVVGRTRFCIEPADLVKNIPTVGGTKDWDLNLIESLRPTLLILDKEENPEFMSQDHEIPYVATHVSDLETCALGIAQIKEALLGEVSADLIERLANLSRRWHHIAELPKNLVPDFDNFPGITEWIKSQRKKSQRFIM